jgi:hypothetical protein
MIPNIAGAIRDEQRLLSVPSQQPHGRFNPTLPHKSQVHRRGFTIRLPGHQRDHDLDGIAPHLLKLIC